MVPYQKVKHYKFVICLVFVFRMVFAFHHHHSRGLVPYYYNYSYNRHHDYRMGHARCPPLAKALVPRLHECGEWDSPQPGQRHITT